jgi:hypothetical protein
VSVNQVEQSIQSGKIIWDVFFKKIFNLWQFGQDLDIKIYIEDELYS